GAVGRLAGGGAAADAARAWGPAARVAAPWARGRPPDPPWDGAAGVDRLQRMAERGRRYGEPGWHRKARPGQLAEACGLAPNRAPVIAAQTDERAREMGGDHHAPAQSRMVTT